LHWHPREFCTGSCDQPFDARGQHSTSIITRRVQKIVKKHNPDEPLFAYLAYVALHAPYQAPKRYRNKFRDKPWHTRRKGYAAMLNQMDTEIGKLIRTLKNKDMWKDTLLVFVSDNGASKGLQDGKAFHGQKFELYEGGINVDGFISGPARAKLGIRKGKFPHMFHATDWLPTLASLVGAMPQGQKLDGIDQIKAIRTNEQQRKGFFIGYNFKKQKNGPARATSKAIRHLQWKLIHIFRGQDPRYRGKDTYELYNVKADRQEKRKVRGRRWGRIRKILKRTLKNFQFPPQQPRSNRKCKSALTRTKWGKVYKKPHCSCQVLGRCARNVEGGRRRTQEKNNNKKTI